MGNLSSSGISLKTIPMDVLELIAHNVTLLEPLGPPHGLLMLSSTCRYLYGALAMRNNTSIYGNAFRSKFDMAAARRRFAFPGETRVRSSGLAVELRARFTALHYMRKAVRTQNVFLLEPEETVARLWTVYFMCLESDGRNARYLMRYGQMRAYARLCVDHYLFQSLDEPGLMPETIDRCLMLWLVWFSTSWDTLYTEDGTFENKMIQFLRPLVYSNFQYKVYFAPWMLYDLPAGTSPENNGHPTSQPNRYTADVDLSEALAMVTRYGTPLRITPPLLVHAAMLCYFSRLEKRNVYEGLTNIPVDQLSSMFTFRLPTLKDSTLYDNDFHRMRMCIDPKASQGISRATLGGIFAGDWEGRFAFTDFDSFREMLEGDDNAVHNSVIAQQPQVWSISEHHYVFPPNFRKPSNLPNPGARDGLTPAQHPVPRGLAVAGYLPADADFTEIPRSSSPDSPNRSPSNRPKSRSPTETSNSDSLTNPMLIIKYTDPYSGVRLQAKYDTWTQGDVSFDEAHARDVRQAVARASHRGDRPGYVPPPVDPLAAVDFYSDPYGFSGVYPLEACLLPTVSRNSSDEKESLVDLPPEGLEDVGPDDIILTGKGHSAWGPFLLQGRVRPWDGLISVVKKYIGNDGRGAWVYRGYILNNGIWVGRWRDTMTEEDTNGYEGVFAMTKRSSVNGS